MSGRPPEMLAATVTDAQPRGDMDERASRDGTHMCADRAAPSLLQRSWQPRPKHSGRQFSGWSDCSYFTFAQCQASFIPPGGSCEANPFSYEVTPPPATRARR
jgi:hypothetical protein